MKRNRISIKDVAAEAGVSIATVSHVVNHTKAVSEELTARVTAAAEKLNYHAAPAARSLKSGRTMVLGVIITNINRVFFTQVLKGIQAEAGLYGYHILLFDSNDSFENEKNFIGILESEWVDGIILDTAAPAGEKEYFSRLRHLGCSGKPIPVVNLERDLSEYRIDSVSVNNVQGGRMATEHLISYGCQNIAYIQGPPGSQMGRDRYQGYLSALENGGLSADPSLVLSGDFTPLSGYTETKKLLMYHPNFDGIFAANDQMAIGALKACHEHGKTVPGDIKMVGFDNTFVSSLVSPALTTLDVPKYQMGQTAVRVLMNRISDDSSPAVNETMPLTLIERTSTSLNGDKNWDLFGW